MAVVFRAGAQNDANSASGTVTVPAGCQVGDVGVLHFSQGNSDVQTSTPTGLTLEDTDTTTASFINKLYVFVVDGVNISAGTVLTFSMSATRQWSLSLGTWSGVSTSAPWIDYRKSSSTTVTTVPSYTTVQNSWPVEVACSKANGTAITAWTVGTGYTQRAMAVSGGTSGPSSVVADNNTGQVGSGVALGGETYTSNQAATAHVRYIIALRPAVSAQTFTDPAGSTDTVISSLRKFMTINDVTNSTDTGQTIGYTAVFTDPAGSTDSLAGNPVNPLEIDDVTNMTDVMEYSLGQPLFTPPTRAYTPSVVPETPRWQQSPARFFSRTNIPKPVNVFKLLDGTYTEQQSGADFWSTVDIAYYGGHTYVVSLAEAAALNAAGYTTSTG